MANYTISNQYGSDQWFLRDKVYDRAIKSALVHDEYYDTQVEKPSRVAILPKRDWTLDHIGVAVDENDEFTYDVDRQIAHKETGGTHYAYNFGEL
jgi:hypothetical protein